MKKQLMIPSNIGDITLKQHQEMLSKGDKLTDEQVVSIYCNITLDEVLHLPNNVYDKALDVIGRTLQTTQEEQPLQMRFEFDGIQYGMIPNLDEISYGENKDLTSYLSDWKSMHLAMAVLFRPITSTLGSTYSIEKYNGTKQGRDIMQHMPLNIVLGAQLFFYRLTEELLKAIPNYLERQVIKHKEDQQTQQEYTKQTGDDMMKCIASLRETLDGLTK